MVGCDVLDWPQRCEQKLIFVDQTRIILRLKLGSKNSLYVTISEDWGLDGS